MTQTPSSWTVLSMLKWATSYLTEKEVKSPRFSIEWLLAHVLKVKRLDLYLLYDRPLSSGELDSLRSLVKRRARQEPLQYITGETDFLNTRIKVQPGVLIPRMETEQLVDIILNEDFDSTQINALDIGTGSGCIAIALKKNQPEWNVTATDVSNEALEIGKKNALLNDVIVHFKKDDMFASTAFQSSENFDLIVSNPPYILENEKELLDKEVIAYEPELALFCSSTSKMYGAVINFSIEKLANKGALFLELHENHAQEVLSLFSSDIWTAGILKDYDGKDRFIYGKKIK